MSHGANKKQEAILAKRLNVQAPQNVSKTPKYED